LIDGWKGRSEKFNARIHAERGHEESAARKSYLGGGSVLARIPRFASDRDIHTAWKKTVGEE